MEHFPSPYESAGTAPSPVDRDSSKTEKSSKKKKSGNGENAADTTKSVNEQRRAPSSITLDKLFQTLSKQVPEKAEPVKPPPEDMKSETAKDVSKDAAARAETPDARVEDVAGDDAERLTDKPLDDNEKTTAALALNNAREEEINDEIAALEAGGAGVSPEALAAARAGKDFRGALGSELQQGTNPDEAIHNAGRTVTGIELPDLSDITDEGAQAGEIDTDDMAQFDAAYDSGSHDVRQESTPDDARAHEDTAAQGSGGSAGGAPPRGPGLNFASFFAFNRLPGAGVAEAAPAAAGATAAEAVRPSRLNLPLIIIAYMLGRRAGRKKTEKRFQPTAEKLKDLQGEVGRIQARQAAAEAQVRSLAWENEARKRQMAAMEVGEVAAQAAPAAGRTQEAMRPAANAEKAPSAFKPEGHRIEGAKTVVQVERLSEHELLEIAKNIRYGERNEQTVADLFDNHSIGRRGLENIVKAHLAGEDIQRVMTDELMAYERDPSYHTIKQFDDAGAVEGGGTESTAEEASAQQAPTTQPPAPGQQLPVDNPNGSQARNAPQALVVANIVAVIVLVALVVVGIVVWLLNR